jgi:hypothetical protein
LASDSTNRGPPTPPALNSASTANIAERSSGTFKPWSGGTTVRVGSNSNDSAAIRATRRGKAAIHPKQIDAINQAFTPSPEAIDEAHHILAAAKNGVGIVNGKMVDIAMVRRAHRTLARCSPELLESEPYDN